MLEQLPSGEWIDAAKIARVLPPESMAAGLTGVRCRVTFLLATGEQATVACADEAAARQLVAKWVAKANAAHAELPPPLAAPTWLLLHRGEWHHVVNTSTGMCFSARIGDTVNVSRIGANGDDYIMADCDIVTLARTLGAVEVPAVRQEDVA